MGPQAAENNRILLISYVFPPAGGVAVQRALSLVRYLPENGFKVHVLSCSNPAVPTMDPKLLERIPESVTVHRVASPEVPFAIRKKIWGLLGGGKNKPASPAKPAEAGSATRSKPSLLNRSVQALMQQIFCPDPEIVWNPFAVRRARKIVEREKIDTILVTLPPFSSLLVALQLKREFPHIRLIADFRDEWLGYYLNTFPFFRAANIRRAAVRIERRTAEEADLIVAVTPAVQNLMRERYPDLPPQKFGLIPNGFDPESLAGFTPRARSCEEPKSVVIGYAGTIHNTSTPVQYLDGLDALPEELSSRVETRIIGRVTEEQAPFLENRKTSIRRFGFLPQSESFRLLEEVDYLLLIEQHGPTIPGKLLEYLALGKPILAIGADGGEVARILRETGSGWSADPAKPADVKAMLEKAVRGALAGTTALQPNRALIERFNRRNLTREYAGLLRGGAVSN